MPNTAETARITLSEFLLARIAEDEAHVGGERHPFHIHNDRVDAEEGYGPCWMLLPGDRMCVLPEGHVANSPRTLAECEAKRRIVADLTSERHAVVEDGWYTCAAATEDVDGGECIDDLRRGTGCDCGRDHLVNRRLGILAAVYADHPDYRAEWRA